MLVKIGFLNYGDILPNCAIEDFKKDMDPNPWFFPPTVNR